MTTITSSTDVVVSVEPLFTDAERIALAGFLAGYNGLTRDAYTLDLRMFTAWCQQHGLHLFQARRADIECFDRDLEAKGRARATIARRLCTISGFYRYAVEEELLEHSPAVHVRRPRLNYGSHAVGLDRNEVGPRATCLLSHDRTAVDQGHRAIDLRVRSASPEPTTRARGQRRRVRTSS